MSKSLGTGIDPLILIDKYGADATRFGLIYQAFGGQDIRFNEDVIMMGKKFANKLWNISRFVSLQTGENLDADLNGAQLDEESKNIFEKYKTVQKEVESNLEKYNFGEAAHAIYEFLWHDFADKYIEYSKTKDDESVKKVLSFVLLNSLKLLHPFMPFITEEIWGNLGQKELLLVSKWPEIANSL